MGIEEAKSALSWLCLTVLEVSMVNPKSSVKVYNSAGKLSNKAFVVQ